MLEPDRRALLDSPDTQGMIAAAAKRAGIADGVGYLARDDVMSELTLVAIEAAAKFDPSRGAKFTTYLWPRLWGRAVDLRRRYGRQARDGQPRPVEVDIEAADSLEDGTAELNLEPGLMDMLDRLPGRERTALLMREVGGVPATEIGHILGLGKSKAKALRRQAVRRLHVAMGR